MDLLTRFLVLRLKEVKGLNVTPETRQSITDVVDLCKQGKHVRVGRGADAYQLFYLAACCFYCFALVACAAERVNDARVACGERCLKVGCVLCRRYVMEGPWGAFGGGSKGLLVVAHAAAAESPAPCDRIAHGKRQPNGVRSQPVMLGVQRV